MSKGGIKTADSRNNLVWDVQRGWLAVVGIPHPRERLKVVGPEGSAAGEPPLEGGHRGQRGVPYPSARKWERGFPGAHCLSGDGRPAVEGLVPSVPEHRLISQKQPLSLTLNLGIFCLESCVPASAAFCSLSEAVGVESLLCLVNLLPNSRWTFIYSERSVCESWSTWISRTGEKNYFNFAVLNKHLLTGNAM